MTHHQFKAYSNQYLRMKILFVRALNPYFESSASANRYSGLLNGLMEQGVQVTLVITNGYNNFHEYSLKGKPTDNINLKVKYLIPTFHHNIWLRRINGYLLSEIFQIIINFRLKYFFKLDYNLIWLTYEKKILASYCKNKSIIKGKSLIELNEFNDLHVKDVQSGNFLQQRNAEKENIILLNALKQIDLIAVMTKTLIHHYSYMSKPDASFLHLPMTVDLSRFDNNFALNQLFIKPYLAYTGTFNNQKDGVDILIKAFALLAPKHENLKLYLAGFYHYDVERNTELIKHLGLKDRIVNIGILNKNEIPSFLKHASLLVMARPDSRQAQGGFPTKLGEYLATGNPVCVTKVGEIPDYLEDRVSAFLADPGDVESFAKAMDTALSNPELAKMVGKNGRKVAEDHFDAKVQSKNLYDFIFENLKKT